MNLRTIIATVVVLIAGVAAFWQGTDGFRAATSEGARRIEVLRQPRALPPAALEDQDGVVFHLHDYRGKLIVLEFIYTRCPRICLALGTSFEHLRDLVQASILKDHVVLLTVTFDLAHDGPAELSAFADLYGGAGDGWRFARPRSAEDLERLLDAFGVIVKPDGYGGYVHNAAIHVVDGAGQLVRILDGDAVDETIAELQRRTG